MSCRSFPKPYQDLIELPGNGFSSRTQVTGGMLLLASVLETHLIAGKASSWQIHISGKAKRAPKASEGNRGESSESR